VSLSNLQVINAILFVPENDCNWRALPKRYGKWHTIYTRINRWAKVGVLLKALRVLTFIGLPRMLGAP
jgi:transposase